MQQHVERPAAPAPRLLVSVGEAATVLGGLGRVHIYWLLKRREIRSVSIGRRRLVVLASIEEYVQRLEAEGGGDDAA
jgi:excisionase family DNA binding protein